MQRAGTAGSTEGLGLGGQSTLGPGTMLQSQILGGGHGKLGKNLKSGVGKESLAFQEVWLGLENELNWGLGKT